MNRGAAVESGPIHEEPLVRFEHVYKIYRTGDSGIAALGGVTFEIRGGEFVAMVGPSGAGKSSILNLMGGLDRATAGEVRVAGEDLVRLPDQLLTLHRRDQVRLA